VNAIRLRPASPSAWSDDEVRARVYDWSDRPARLPVIPPACIEYAVVREDGTFVCAGLNLDLAGDGSTPEEAEAAFREAVALWYQHQAELREAAPVVRVGALAAA
jgi:predicted RNase H-like HicB family nuclease